MDGYSGLCAHLAMSILVRSSVSVASTSIHLRCSEGYAKIQTNVLLARSCILELHIGKLAYFMGQYLTILFF